MKNEIKHTEEFDLYLKNYLSVEERAAFEKKLANDSELAQEFEFYQLMVEGIRESERRALKAHIQANKGNMFWGQNIWPKKMTYAAAAVIALFVGLYVVIKQQDLTPEKSIAINENKAPIAKEPTATELSVDSSKSENSKDIAANIQSIDEVQFETPDLQEIPVESDMIDDNKGLAESPAVINQTYNDYDGIKDQETVLSEVKLKDTIILLALLTKPELLSDNMISNQVESTRAYRYKHLPKNDNNQAPAKESKKPSSVQSDSFSRTDATVFTKNKKNSTEKTVTKLNVEFWKSPVNFKGYSYDNNVMKLYGVDEKAVRYFFVNSKIYLRMDGTVYEIKFCPESCPFISINDNEMMIYILNLP